MPKWFISLHIIHGEGLISYLGFMATFYASTSGKIFNIGKAINRENFVLSESHKPKKYNATTSF